ncbi:P-loop containing nucleoside triphosphate hydrolase protein [Amylostereum chailletii]|nr:P-loop containing nucleoside triphosphate hydrolase protein [Amylostereum chailletii]
MSPSHPLGPTKSESPQPDTEPPPPPPPDSLFHAWLASRTLTPNVPGSISARRPITKDSVRLAHKTLHLCAPEMLKLFWNSHPLRTLLVLAVSFLRGVFPVFKGYSHAMIINEIQHLISSDNFAWSHLIHLLGTEFLRIAAEKLLESCAADNEQFVQSSARFLIEYQQMELRVRLDVPALSDPLVRELLAESDMFVASFQGVGGFGLLSPFDFIRIFTLLSEIVSHIFILTSLVNGPLPLVALLFSLLSSAVPFFQTSYGYRFDTPTFSEYEVRQAENQEQMRQLALSEGYRPEVMLFGLGPWILDAWAHARKTALGLYSSPKPSLSGVTALFSQFTTTEAITALQNIPFVLMLQSSTALGSLALYRTSAQAIVFATSNLIVTVQMVIQGIFLMGAFCASMEIKPQLQPKREDRLPYVSRRGGMKIEARELGYTYPGCSEPALRDVSFTLEAGETLAIVGYNGSGKSTLAKVLLRLVDFDPGQLRVNDVDVRQYEPPELHRATSAVLQNFAKFAGASVGENVGMGFVADMERPGALRAALRRAESEAVVAGLPHGLNTRLDALAFDAASCAPSSPHGVGENGKPAWMPHGLSGGEWQRIALARAFMRAHRPEVDLLLFDEPTSALDAHAQSKIFDTIDAVARAPDGSKRKTVVFITHRLATARRADKVAMMELGRIIEFGTHEALLARGGAYAALYRASV